MDQEYHIRQWCSHYDHLDVIWSCTIRVFSGKLNSRVMYNTLYTLLLIVTLKQNCWAEHCYVFGSLQYQNIQENKRKTGGNIIIIMMSRHFDSAISFFTFLLSIHAKLCVSTMVLFPLNFLYARIRIYSKMAMIMNTRHARTHSMIAVTLPPDLGELCDNELKILMAQRKRVNNVPSLPGMAEIGMRKLVCKLRSCFFA